MCGVGGTPWVEMMALSKLASTKYSKWACHIQRCYMGFSPLIFRITNMIPCY